MSKPYNLDIQNIVACAWFENEFDLFDIAVKFPFCTDYEPEKFPGLIYRIREAKKHTALIFKAGKMVCPGNKTFEDVNTCVGRVVKDLKSKGVYIKKDPRVEVVNIVASGDLKRGVNLEYGSSVIPRAFYEPDQFPALMCRMESPKAKFLLYSNGKIICLGTKTERDLHEAVGSLRMYLEDKKLFI